MEEKLQSQRSKSDGVEYQPRFILRTGYANQMVRLEIEDNGLGIEEDARKKVFEPFYTTKKAGEGTGLGLSISYFIVTDTHRGHLLVESTPQVSSCFIVELPQTQD